MSGLLMLVVFAVLVAAWGGLISWRWNRRVERARQSLASPNRRVGL